MFSAVQHLEKYLEVSDEKEMRSRKRWTRRSLRRRMQWGRRRLWKRDLKEIAEICRLKLLNCTSIKCKVINYKPIRLCKELLLNYFKEIAQLIKLIIKVRLGDIV